MVGGLVHAVQTVRLGHPGGRLVDVARGEMFDADDPLVKAYPDVFEQETGSDAPARSATKAEWVDYAVTQGLGREEADSATKADLIDLFTGGGADDE